LGMARRTERHQAVEIEVRAPLGALDDVVDLLRLRGLRARESPAGAGPSSHHGSVIPLP